MNFEVETLNEMLARSTTEAREYQAELMVAAQDDIGSKMRIEELQLSMQHAIMSFKQQFDLATRTNTDLQLINSKAYDELTEYNSEIESLRQQLTIAYNESKTSEETVRKVEGE